MSSLPRPVGIVATGSYLPPRVLTNADLEQMVETSDEWIKTRVGISERRIAEPEVATSDLVVPAAQACLANAEVSAEEAAGVAGWEVIVPAPDPVGNVSALIVEHAYHIKWAIPVIT